MSYPEVVFGTDGWRAILGEGFTSDRFASVVKALMQTSRMKKALKGNEPVLVAHDTRFQARRFACLAANMLNKAGYDVVLSDGPTATPGICAAIVGRSGAAGIMITASHNPPEYLGFKIKGDYGGSAQPKWINELGRKLDTVKRQPAARPVRLPASPDSGIEVADLNDEHLARLRSFIQPSPGRDMIVHDAMFGSGRGLLKRALAGTGAAVKQLRSAENPGFGGDGPEPVEPRLRGMCRAVKSTDARMGIATDGDADRVAACDARGQFVYPHEIMALMTTFLVDRMGKKGAIVRNFATSELVRKVAEDRGLKVVTTPVGFKHIVGEMLSGGVLLGGEESGGIAVTEFLPERDGILCGVILREMIIQNRKPLHTQLNALYKQYGRSVYRRWDLHIPASDKESILGRLKKCPPTELANRDIVRIDRLDGNKFLFDNDAWLLVRASGTEPILRVYVEAENDRQVEKLYDGFSSWVSNK